MDFITQADQLLTVGGLAMVIGLLTQFITKPVLEKRYGLDEGGPISNRSLADYRIAMNIISGITGIILALAASLVAEEIEASSILMSILNGVAGAVLAVGGYEFLSNGFDKVT